MCYQRRERIVLAELDGRSSQIVDQAHIAQGVILEASSALGRILVLEPPCPDTVLGILRLGDAPISNTPGRNKLIVIVNEELVTW